MMRWIKIDGTLVNLNNIVAVQNRDELGKSYKGVGWMMLVVAAYSEKITELDYIYFEDKPCVREAYAWLSRQCEMTFEDRKAE